MYDNLCKRIPFYCIGSPFLARRARLENQTLAVKKQVVVCRIGDSCLTAIMEQVVPSPGDGREACYIEPIACKPISTGLAIVGQAYLGCQGTAVGDIYFQIVDGRSGIADGDGTHGSPD